MVEAKETLAKLSGPPARKAEPADPHALVAIDALARGTYREALKDMHAQAWGVAELGRAFSDLFRAYEGGDFKPVAEALAVYCDLNGTVPGSELYRELGDALLVAQMHAITGRQNALDHKATPEPDSFLNFVPIDPLTLKPLTTGSRDGLIFTEVAHRFIVEKQRDPAFALTAGQSFGGYADRHQLNRLAAIVEAIRYGNSV